jgi:ADP-heptose:LPS heptosyltransferase
VSEPTKDIPQRVLIVRLSAFGDCLHAIPTVVALRRHFPNVEIGWAIEELSHTLLRDHPLVNRFHVFPRHAFKQKRGNLFERMRSMQRFRKELAEVKYDVAIDLQGLTKSGLVSWWSGAKRRIGFKGEESREFNLVFNNERVAPTDEAVHVVEKNLTLLRPLGVRIPDKPEWVLPDYRLRRRVRRDQSVPERLRAAERRNSRPLRTGQPGRDVVHQALAAGAVRRSLSRVDQAPRSEDRHSVGRSG